MLIMLAYLFNVDVLWLFKYILQREWSFTYYLGSYWTTLVDNVLTNRRPPVPSIHIPLDMRMHFASPTVVVYIRRGLQFKIYLKFCNCCLFSFGHCILCHSSIYGFWLLLWYLRFTASGYPFGILDLRLLVTPLVSSKRTIVVFNVEKI
jgi:hypothetical protein